MSVSRRRFLQTVSLGAFTYPRSRTGRSTWADTSKSRNSPRVHSVRDLGIQFMNNPVNITGQDAATSVVLPDGKTFWIFGDTIEGPFDSIRHYDLTKVLSNTAAIVPRHEVSQGIKRFSYLMSDENKRARQFIEFGPDEDPAKHRLWAIHGVCVGEFLYIYYHKITMVPEKDVFEDFKLDGMGIARARIGEYQFERLRAQDGSMMWWRGDQPSFGVFIETNSDGYIYLWGSFWTGMYLARVRPESIEDLASYEYLIKAPTLDLRNVQPKWAKTHDSSGVLFDSVPNEMSAAYNPYLRQYVAVHMLNRNNKIVMRTAPKLTGPWSEPELIFRPQRTSDEDLFNAAKEHPELQARGGKVMYITYVNSAEYAPHLIEVTLA